MTCLKKKSTHTHTHTLKYKGHTHKYKGETHTHTHKYKGEFWAEREWWFILGQKPDAEGNLPVFASSLPRETLWAVPGFQMCFLS